MCISEKCESLIETILLSVRRLINLTNMLWFMRMGQMLDLSMLTHRCLYGFNKNGKLNLNS